MGEIVSHKKNFSGISPEDGHIFFDYRMTSEAYLDQPRFNIYNKKSDNAEDDKNNRYYVSNRRLRSQTERINTNLSKFSLNSIHPSATFLQQQFDKQNDTILAQKASTQGSEYCKTNLNINNEESMAFTNIPSYRKGGISERTNYNKGNQSLMSSEKCKGKSLMTERFWPNNFQGDYFSKVPYVPQMDAIEQNDR